VRTLRDHSLSLFFLAIFAAALVGQAIAGNAEFNNEAVAHDSETLSFWAYVVSPDFGQAVMENWQSEYLQFTLFIFATVWFVQKGSPESKNVDEAGTQSDEEQWVGEHARPDSPKWARTRGIKLFLYSNSLLLVIGGDLARLLVRSVADRLAHVQRDPARARGLDAELAAVPRQRRLLADDAAELAVGVPGGRLDGGVRDLPAPARLAGVQAGRRPARDHGRRGLDD
jgi:hypothetical protein